MSNRCLPAELLDTVADFLHDSRKALKNCCLVGKSWVPRTRKFLFASVRFRTVEDVESWKSTFPDPSTSPALYAKALFIECPWAATVADAEEGGWIQTFSHVVHLEVKHMSGRGGEFVNYLVPFHGFSPAIKSLDLIYIPLPLSLVFDLIRSFPLLEDLCVLAAIRHVIGVNDGLEFDRQPTTIQSSRPPVFTGSLKLYGVNHIVSHFVSLPGGLHFREFDLTWSGEADISSTTLLVESCRSTLESLSIDYSIFMNSFSDSIDLSKATKLKKLSFVCESDPQWIAATLKTVTLKHRELQAISINPRWILFSLDPDHVDPAYLRRLIGESACQGWSEVDHLLARLSELCPFRLKVQYTFPSFISGEGAKQLMEGLLPEVSVRGVVDMVGWGDTSFL